MSARRQTEPKERSELPSERTLAVWIKTWTATLSGLRKREISTFDDPADPWEDVADSKVVHLGGHGARGIFGKNDGIAVFPCLSCRRLDAHVRCDASQNDCLDTAAAQLQIQLRAMEGAPLPLGDENVARLRTRAVVLDRVQACFFACRIDVQCFTALIEHILT